MKNMPEIDELVIIRIKKIYPYGAFCQFEEYPGLEGFVHLSEVASRWVKNIHNFLKEGQRTVGRVYRIIPEKNMVDVSLRRVTENDKNIKMEQFRRKKRGEKLLEVVAASVKKSKVSLREIIPIIEKKYEDIYSVFEDVMVKGAEPLEKINIPSEWITKIVEVAEKNIKKQKKRIYGIFTISISAPNGIHIIKEALKIITDKGGEVTYLGAPNYMVHVEAEDYKKCEKKLNLIVSAVSHYIKENEGNCSFKKKED
jgi:translation initiation factor 2 subunit 1